MPLNPNTAYCYRVSSLCVNEGCIQHQNAAVLVFLLWRSFLKAIFICLFLYQIVKLISFIKEQAIWYSRKHSRVAGFQKYACHLVLLVTCASLQNIAAAVNVICVYRQNWCNTFLCLSKVFAVLDSLINTLIGIYANGAKTWFIWTFLIWDSFPHLLPIQMSTVLPQEAILLSAF